MPIITVTIDGKTYRMACGAGEEAHLTALTEDLSARVARMRSSFGEIGDMRLHVMAALTVSDELSELRGRLAGLEAEAVRARAEAEAALRARDEAAARAADGIERAAGRITRLADALAAGSRPGETA